MLQTVSRHEVRRRIRRRIRRKVRGSATRPRLAVFRSYRHIYVQAIDDDSGRTLAQASTRDKSLRGSLEKSGNVDAAKVVGKAIAERLKDAGVDRGVLDRGGYLYHGRVKALADAAREAGLTL